MRKDLFKATKRSIIAISTAIVFLCLIVFAVITQTIYTSRVLDSVDKSIGQLQKAINEDEIAYEKFIGQFNDEVKFNASPHMPNKNIYGKNSDKDSNLFRIPPNLIVIIYKNNQVEKMSRNMYFDEDNFPDFSEVKNNTISTIEYGEYKFRGISIAKENGYSIHILSNIDSEMHSVSRLTTALIASFIILLIFAVLLSAYLASKVIKPVKEAYEKQVHFVQDASHEMRTPLAVIKGKLELLAHSSNDTIDSHFEYISKIMSEVRGLEKLNSDLLLLSKEDLDLGIAITTFNLNDIINDISEFYSDIADMKKKNFNVIKPEKNIQVTWDYSKMRRAIIILLENAFKYTGENGQIDFIIEEQNKFIKITVKDNGIGIKEEEQKRIFDRFYRSEKVRGDNINGSGIGLSLLKSICGNFQIKLKVNSELGKGSEFSMIIPKAFIKN